MLRNIDNNRITYKLSINNNNNNKKMMNTIKTIGVHDGWITTVIYG